MKPKKFLAVVTAATMIAANSIGLMPDKFINLPVFTANAADIVDSGECGAEGDNVTWKLDSDGTLTISGEGAMADYLRITPWDKGSIIRVQIDDGVTSIGERAFDYCRNLISITIPNSVTNIGASAFEDCENLTSITIPNSVTGIGGDAFYGTPWFEAKQKENPLVIENGILINGTICEGDVVIPDSVTTIGDNAFEYCEALTSITIPDSVTTIGDGTFFHCEKLTSITIPDSVTSIGIYTFGYCYCLTSITIPDSVTTIGFCAFYYCNNLTSITIPDSVTSIEDMAFQYCENLTSINVDSENKNYVSEDGVLFNEDKSMLIHYPAGKTAEVYIIPDGVTSIVGEAFSGCNSLTTITIPDSVTSIGDCAFADCEELTSVTINNPECEIYDNFYTLSDSATIYGYKNSTAQAYAEKYDRTFVALEEEKPTAIELGDVNNDGSVDSSDASLVLAEYAKIQTGGAGEFSENQHKAADVNKDDVVDSSDASKILAYYAMVSTGKEPTWD